MPHINAFLPAGSSLAPNVGDSTSFSVTTDQELTSMTWTQDGTEIASGTMETMVNWDTAGSYNIGFAGSNDNGSVSQAWTVTVTEAEEAAPGAPGAPGATPQDAGDASVITITPSTLTVVPGETFTADVSIDPEVPMTGAQFDLIFGSSSMNVNGIVEGSLFSQTGTTMFSAGTIDNDAGEVSNTYVTLLGEGYVFGEGVMATVDLTAGSTTGYAQLNLVDVVISDPDSNAVSVSTSNATILVDTAPTMGSIGSQAVVETSALSFTVSGSDVDGDSLIYSATGLPEGASLDTATGVFSWTPSVGQAGTYTMSFTVTDGYLNDSETATITVASLNNAPVMGSIGSQAVEEVSTLSFTVSGSDADGDSLTYSAADMPGGASLDTTTGVFSWTPAEGQAGTYTVSFTVTDGALSDTESATIVVSELNHAPVMGSISSQSVVEASALSFTVSGSDVDGDNLVYSATDMPEGANFDTATGVFGWIPSVGQAGTYTVYFTVTDGEFSDTESATIVVSELNHAPVINTLVPSDGSTYNEAESINIEASASDEDGDALSYIIKIDGVTISTLSSYVWNTDYSSAGTHTIEVTVSDGTETTSMQHSITINDVHPRWDVNEDGEVNILDITLIGQQYGNTVSTPYPRWDVNQDGVINIQDLTVTSYHFGETVD
ncbi:MAG: putative Ig domain-containing protein [Methanosarcinaceae archaeon]|nr:putative Ig domain-containing protein [Methanosarcinaceae archaeon]